MTGDFIIETQNQLYGQRWGAVLAASIILHLFLFSVVVFLPSLAPSRGMSNIVYEVDLVDMPSNIRTEAASASKAEKKPVETDTSAKRIAIKEENKTSTEVEKISINKKKTTVKKQEKTVKSNDANHLNKAISDLKQKTQSEETQQAHLDQAISQLQNEVGGTSTNTGTSRAGGGGSLAMIIYQENVKSHIRNNWSYPAAMQNRKDLEVIVLLKTRQDGTILVSEFLKKSGDSIFDQSVIKAIEKSNPIPPFPEGYEKRYEEFEIRFTLKELMDN